MVRRDYPRNSRLSKSCSSRGRTFREWAKVWLLTRWWPQPISDYWSWESRRFSKALEFRPPNLRTQTVPIRQWIHFIWKAHRMSQWARLSFLKCHLRTHSLLTHIPTSLGRRRCRLFLRAWSQILHWSRTDPSIKTAPLLATELKLKSKTLTIRSSRKRNKPKDKSSSRPRT